MIVLIAGCSGSGKSTVSQIVARRLGVPSFCLDDYFVRGARVFVDHGGSKVRTFERPELYDGARMARDLARCGNAVAEGFCLLSYPEMQQLAARRFFIDIPFAECLRRRRGRPNRPSDRSFELIGESEATRFVLPQRGMPGVTCVDGRASPDAIASKMLTIVDPSRCW